ncbi:transposase tc1-like protein [Diplodia corticola]|uniref:Transposase tc1-like protein n=1 Tax=Diplodia corticola TaxID=236234 RepID=A0A1J9R4R0_9PEZI|nr:transposase tc1-like protein [Diplodia corticola]OJD35218.1 transposase tc1-like protein [Diplodia corticola]
MVGVPGRSSGCHTCRARHIKCDERKPTCRRCEKSGYTCQGYEKPIHFLIHTAAGQSSSSTSSAGATPSPSPVPLATRSKALAKPRPQPQPQPQPPPRRRDAQDQRVATRRKQQFAYYFPAVPQELGLDGFVDDMAFSFTFSNLVYSSFGRPWLQLAAKGAVDDMSLSACKALALGFFGNSQRQKKVQDRGAGEYGVSLRLLIEELSKVDQENAGKYIIPVMVMLMYSFSVAKKADFSHHDGLKQLVLLCGPEKFQHQPWLSAFEATRDLLISKALLERKRTFLEEFRWRTTPWALDPAAKSPSNELMDILSEVPGFLEDEATLKTTDDTPLRIGLLTRVEKCLQNLYHWRWRWESKNPNAVFEVTAKPPGDMKMSEVPPGLQTSLRYQKWLQANEICLYNAVLLWILRFLAELRPTAFPYPSPSPSSQRSSPAASPQSADSPQSLQSSDEYTYLQDHILANMPRTPLLLPGQARSLRQPAMEICRSFEYLLETFAKSNDIALSWLMPISLAYYVLQDDRDYARWVRKKVDGFEGKVEPPFSCFALKMRYRDDECGNCQLKRSFRNTSKPGPWERDGLCLHDRFLTPHRSGMFGFSPPSKGLPRASTFRYLGGAPEHQP